MTTGAMIQGHQSVSGRSSSTKGAATSAAIKIRDCRRTGTSGQVIVIGDTLSSLRSS